MSSDIRATARQVRKEALEALRKMERSEDAGVTRSEVANLRRRLESCHLLDGGPASKTRKSGAVHAGVHRPPSYTNLSSSPGQPSNCQSSYMSWLHARPQALKTMVEASRRSASVPSSK